MDYHLTPSLFVDDGGALTGISSLMMSEEFETNFTSTNPGLRLDLSLLFVVVVAAGSSHKKQEAATLHRPALTHSGDEEGRRSWS